MIPIHHIHIHKYTLHTYTLFIAAFRLFIKQKNWKGLKRIKALLTLEKLQIRNNRLQTVKVNGRTTGIGMQIATNTLKESRLLIAMLGVYAEEINKA